MGTPLAGIHDRGCGSIQSFSARRGVPGTVPRALGSLGFGTLSWVTYKRTYSRDGEEWWQTCRRVMEGIMTVYRVHCLEQGLPWDATEAHRITEAAYERVWEFKWTPPGRGLWIMGTRFMYERGGAALNNCGFISTKNIASNYADPFVWVLNSKPVFARAARANSSDTFSMDPPRASSLGEPP